MKKVIVPLDFSETGNNAFNFANHLATDFEVPLQAIHVYKVATSQTTEPANIQVYIDNATEKLNSFVAERNKGGASNIVGELLIGFPADKILNYAKETDDACVVLGTHGEQSVVRNFFGSVSTKVGMDCDKPVWIIPPDVKYSKFKKIAFCTNDPIGDTSVADEITPLLQKSEGELHILNVFDFVDVDKSEVFDTWESHVPKEKLKFEILYDVDIVDALYGYCKDNDVDLIIINRKRRSFLSMLFNKSITKEMIIKSDIPLLIMHN